MQSHLIPFNCFGEGWLTNKPTKLKIKYWRDYNLLQGAARLQEVAAIHQI